MTAANETDELFHPVGDHRAWSESYYFNFVDPATGVGAFTRMGFRPNDGWADALHAVYLPGGRVAFTYGRRTDLTPELVDGFGLADPSVGNLVLGRGQPFQRWNIRYHGEAQDLADPTVMLAATRDRPPGWTRPVRLDMDVTFDALAGPHYAAGGIQGHFEQTGTVTGLIRLGDEEWPVDGFGVRDKSWGPRTWQGPTGADSASLPASEPAAAGPPVGSGAGDGELSGSCFLNWFSMNFGADLALGGACIRSADGVFRGQGWIQRDGVNGELVEATMTTSYDRANPLLHQTVQLQAVDSQGRALTVEGTVLTICPTKIPRPEGVTFVNEGLARFETDGRTGFGIAEHWHAVAR